MRFIPRTQQRSMKSNLPAPTPIIPSKPPGKYDKTNKSNPGFSNESPVYRSTVFFQHDRNHMFII